MGRFVRTTKVGTLSPIGEGTASGGVIGQPEHDASGIKGTRSTAERDTETATTEVPRRLHRATTSNS